MNRLDITLFGRHCHFTAVVLARLLEHGHRIGLIVTPGIDSSGARIVQAPALKPRLALVPASAGGPTVLPTVSSLAWSAGIKVAEVSRDQLVSIPRRYGEASRGVTVSACYPWKLPDAILHAAPLGAINVHPSILPAHRGPDPVFWTLHAGDRVSGATIHRMTATFDHGPILAQRVIGLPNRIRYRDLEEQTLIVGSDLLVDVLARLRNGESVAEEPSAALQTLESLPGEDAYRLDTTWSAERAFRFVYGVASPDRPVIVELPDESIVPVVDAVTLRPGANTSETAARQPGFADVRFNDGVVRFQTVQTAVSD